MTAAVIASVLAVAGFLGIVPHSLEDLGRGVPERFGVTPMAAAWALGALVALHAAAAIAAARGRRWALLALLLLGMGWAAAAAADHPGAFVPGAFREGLLSRLSVWLIVLLEGASGVAAALALRSGR